jgi:hypothetical protein
MPQKAIDMLMSKRNPRTGQNYSKEEAEKIYSRYKRKKSREAHYDMHGHHGPA